MTDDVEPGGDTGRGGAVAMVLLAAALLLIAGARGRAETAPALPDMRLDPAVDPVAALVVLPGVGPVTAGALAGAWDAGPPASPRELLAVRGIGPVTAARVAQHLRLARGTD